LITGKDLLNYLEKVLFTVVILKLSPKLAVHKKVDPDIIIIDLKANNVAISQFV